MDWVRKMSRGEGSLLALVVEDCVKSVSSIRLLRWVACSQASQKLAELALLLSQL